MNVQVHTEEIITMSHRIHEVASLLARTGADLEAVERELGKQSEFGTEIRALVRTEEKVAEERYKIKVLAQALANIGDLYRKTETGIQESFESQAPGPRELHLEMADLGDLQERLKINIYGGDREWQ